ncbi:MAG: bifunctional histidinol-phosphatase/imidazoleglycerol-phosphate dehydratase [Flavobacteriaceae bacterium]|nr:bifunctional histidinol-phosphatase/imidazoleglycerol-phosphate dehydratase [Flavobacteriaceae bacterium]
MKKILFLDRDGTLIKEPKDYQIDSFEKLHFFEGVFENLKKICILEDYELVMITNQDGLGRASFPEDSFWPVQNLIVNTFKDQGIQFREICIDRSFPKENKPTRKPRTGLLNHYLLGDFDIANSLVIGDRLTDMELALNLGCKGVLIQYNPFGEDELTNKTEAIRNEIVLNASSWSEIYEFLLRKNRKVIHHRNTNETKISIELDIDGTGQSIIDTGLGFFDHMLDQLARHGQCDLKINVNGDLDVDEHHTIEDTGIALGEAFKKVLGNKLGVERYGYCLPMDDCLAQFALDFGGRSWISWDATFKRDKVGDMPTEMFYHFFKSFADGASANINLKAEGENEHHKIESIFKAFAKSIKMAVKRDVDNMILPSTKGSL